MVAIANVFMVGVLVAATPELPKRLEPVSIREVAVLSPSGSSSEKWTVIRFINLTAADLTETETDKSGVFVGATRCTVIWFSGGGFCVVPSVADIAQRSIWYSTVLRPNKDVIFEQKRIAGLGWSHPLRDLVRLEPFAAESLNALFEMLPLVK